MFSKERASGKVRPLSTWTWRRKKRREELWEGREGGRSQEGRGVVREGGSS